MGHDISYILAPVLYVALALLPLLPLPARAAGLTIITHGLNGNVDDWVIPMAEKVPAHRAFPGASSSCYRIFFQSQGSAFVLSHQRIGGSAPADTDSGEILVKLDWSQLANDTYSTYQVAAWVAPGLLNPAFIPELGGRALAEFPIHLVGHSRGGSLVCELSRLLGAEGLWVDHLTTLDPHPLNNDGFNDWPYTVIDATATTYANVLYSDNYFQTLNFFVYGKSIHGAYVRQLTNLDGGYGGLTASHSDVHLWYFGTIDAATPTSNSEASIQESQRVNWWTPFESRGANAGFVHSRIARGNRLSTAEPAGAGRGRIKDGVNQWWDFGAGLSDNRAALASNNGAWPNLIQLSLNSTNAHPLGQPVTLHYDYQFGQSFADSADLEFFVDTDANPLNGGISVGALTDQPGTGTDTIRRGTFTFAPSPGALSPGSYQVYGVITGTNNRTRFLHTLHPLILTAPLPPPTLVALGWVDGAFALQANGQPGQTLVLEASGDFDHWTPIATNTLTGPSWMFQDSQSGAIPARFYRAVAAQTGLSK